MQFETRHYWYIGGLIVALLTFVLLVQNYPTNVDGAIAAPSETPAKPKRP